MSQLKRKSKILFHESHWADSYAAYFHENTKYTPAVLAKTRARVSEYLSEPRFLLETTRNHKEYLKERAIQLQSSEPKYLDLKALMATRRSTRTFSGQSILLDDLVNLLGWSAGSSGIQSFQGMDQQDVVHLRSYPSGGGLYPCEVYFIALNVQGLAKGIYHYQTQTHVLNPVAHLPAPAVLSDAFMAQDLIDQIAGIVVITSIFERCCTKYGERGYRLALLEAGHIMQNMLLSAEAQDLGALSWGGFMDNTVSEMLHVSVLEEPPIHCAFLGSKAVEI
ncbi:SagB/ThcOx family dehydrogenase [Photobacterium sp. 1_MG-2023]|uniref:SagB/ThcOx family dehydrogenase n=1 Tax=Photobacterium sp. 1_MG-2023 TaxID=3062646 RepID=UPI0026E2DCB1|nr:SagB/ThcOx family dehydrogenase [Photobacterium sp. 1_MG-2023]MDO6707728.1 SagB/ThcOx family dehydrogenase [Photobacterium sp. 1_MG-2023]